MVAITVSEENENFYSTDGVLYNRYNSLILYPMCKNASEFVIPTGITEISNDAFYNNCYLQKVTIPETVIRIFDNVFGRCEALETVIINTESFEYFGVNVFGNTPVSQPKIGEDGEQIYIGNILYGFCYGGESEAETVAIKDGTAVIAANVFMGCNKIKSVSVPSSVTYIGEMAFADCTSLAEINGTSQVKAVCTEAFSGCTSLERIDLTGVAAIEDSAFKGCTSLSEILLTNDKIEHIGNNVFYGTQFLCNAENYNSDGLMILGKYVVKANPDIVSGEITLPNDITGISSFAFENCTELTGIILSEGICSIDEGVFSGCTSLKSIDLIENIEYVQYSAFSGCTKLEAIYSHNSNCSFYDGCFASVGTALEDGKKTVFYGYEEQEWVQNEFGLTFVLEYHYTSGSCGGDVNWEFDEATGTLSITGNGEMWEWNNPWSYFNDKITSIIIDEGITNVGSNAFSGTAVESIVIPSSVENIGQVAFKNCASLTYVKIKGEVRYLQQSVFEGCGKLEIIELPTCVESVNDRVFYGCSSLGEISFGKNINWISDNSFTGCSALKNIFVDDESYSYNDINGVLFTNDGALIIYPAGKTAESYNLPDTCREIRTAAFAGNTSLKTLYINQNANSIYTEAFDSCGIESFVVDVNNGAFASTDGVIYSKDGYELSFYPPAKADETVTVPDSVNRIRSMRYNSSLKKLIIGKNVDSLDDNAFVNNNALCEIVVNKDNSRYLTQDNVLFRMNGENRETLVLYPAGKTDISYTIPAEKKSIQNCAFRNNKQLEEINISSGITEICNYAFEGCTALGKVNCSSSRYDFIGCNIFDNTAIFNSQQESNTCIIGNILISVHFDDNSEVREYSVPDGIAAIAQNALSDNRCLIEISLPESITYIGERAFAYCENIEAISIPSGVHTIERDTFEGCYNISNISLPDDLTYIADNFSDTDYFRESSNWNNGFLYNKTYLLCGNPGEVNGEITVADGTTVIAEDAFICCNISKVTLPETVIAIGNKAFNNCNGLVEINIPSGVKAIRYQTFAYCEALEKIDLPESVESVEGEAFLNCLALTEITVRNRDCWFDDSSFNNAGKQRETVFKCYKDTNASHIADINGFTLDTSLFHTHSDDNFDGYCDECSATMEVYVYASGFFGENDRISWSVTTDGTITFSGNGAIPDWNRPNGDEFNDRIIKAVIGKDITSVGNGIFQNYSKISVVEILNTASFERIGERAFENCSSLEEIALPSSVNYIGNGAFANCSALKSITVPEGVEVIYNDTFQNCFSLVNVYLPNSLTSVYNNAFVNCTSLADLSFGKNFKDFDVWAFNNCTALNNIFIDDENTALFDENGVVFDSYNSLRYYPAGKTSSEYTIPSFCNNICSNSFLNTVHLRTLNITENVNRIEYAAFYYSRIAEFSVSASNDCYEAQDGVLFTKNIQELICYPPEKQDSQYTVPGSVVYIQSINNNPHLKTLNLSTDLFGISEGGINCNSSLETITVPTTNKSFVSTDGVLFKYENDEKSILVCYPAAKSGSNYTIPENTLRIWRNAFTGAEKLETVSIPESVICIGDEAFKNCESLAQVNSSVYYIEYFGWDVFGNTAVYNNEKSWADGILYIANFLIDVNYHNDTFPEALTIRDGTVAIAPDAIRDNNFITSVNFPVSLTFIGQNAFAYCNSLKKLDLPSNVAAIFSYAFEGCNALSEISLPNSLIYIGENILRNTAYENNPDNWDGNGVLYLDSYVITTDSNALSGTLTIKDGTVLIAVRAFADTRNLKEIILPVSLTTISEEAFILSGIEKIVIPEGITVIENGVFKNCQALKTVILYGVKLVNNNAFENCSNLEKIYFIQNNCIIDFNAFNNSGMSENTKLFGYSDTDVQWAAESHSFIFMSMHDNCDHPETTVKEAVAATCVSTGLTRGEYCKLCGEPLEEQEITEKDSSKHTGIMYLKNAVAATCAENGYSGDLCCDKCNAVITQGNVIYATGNHTWEVTSDTPATCCAYSATNYKCSVCEETKTEYGSEYNANNHDGETEQRNAKEATCGETGYTGNTYCLGCNQKITTGTVINATGNHAWKETSITLATCHSYSATNYKCSVCEQTKTVYGIEYSVNNHDGETELRNAKEATCGENGYTGDTYCLGCNQKLTTGTVIAATGNHVGDTANCAHKASCTVCGKEYGELNPEVHTGATVVKNAIAATCEKAGFSGDIYCADCNILIKSGKEIAPTGAHIYGEWTVISEPTANTEGTRQQKCTVCGNIQAQKIEKLQKISVNTVGGECVNKVNDSVIFTIGSYTKETLKAMLTSGVEFSSSQKAGDKLYTGMTITLKAGEKIIDTITLVVLGDVDGDGNVTSADARLALRAAVKLDIQSDIQILASNADGKSGITSADARLLLRMAVKLDKPEALYDSIF